MPITACSIYLKPTLDSYFPKFKLQRALQKPLELWLHMEYVRAKSKIKMQVPSCSQVYKKIETDWSNHRYSYSARRPFHLSAAKYMQVKVIYWLTWVCTRNEVLTENKYYLQFTDQWKARGNKLTSTRSVVYNHAKSIQYAFFFCHHFCSVEKMAQYLGMPWFSLHYPICIYKITVYQN